MEQSTLPSPSAIPIPGLLLDVQAVLSVLSVAVLLLCANPDGRANGQVLRPELQINLGSYSNPAKPGQPDTAGTIYTTSSDETLGYFRDKGFRTLRLPVNWERLQPEACGPFDKAKLAELGDYLDRIQKAGFRIIIDLHAFGGRDGHQLGSKELPTDALADFWTRLIRHIPGRFAGYDIMNEPHDMPDPSAWPEAAQKTVDAIRKIDRTTTILVEGDDWSNAGRWMHANAGLDIKDPAKRLVYSAHLYFDQDTSGLYKRPWEQERPRPDIAAERLRPFLDWLRTKGFRGHIGEAGVPGDHPGWLQVLERFLVEVTDGADVLTGCAYWAGGDWTDSWNLTVQPVADGKRADRPQMPLLARYIKLRGGNDAPWRPSAFRLRSDGS
ncbi:MAG: glycoside hydrolase family 5 protein [Opitutaceae bacterium]|jgi:aryl-phospho-beta-D-glucosidase BglC (GH1 family)|nr:glycoside hydrolase family 5 protein [Opitutaceae bacterium]